MTVKDCYDMMGGGYEEVIKRLLDDKRVLKFAPLKSDFQRALSNDGTIKTEFAVDMSEVVPEDIIDVEEGEVIETSNE